MNFSTPRSRKSVHTVDSDDDTGNMATTQRPGWTTRSLLIGCVVSATAVFAGDRGLPDHAPATTNPLSIVTATATELKAERTRLLQLPDQQLDTLARRGDRSAQLILAERYAEEAESLTFVPTAANDALADAAYWYSRAARRGFPGAARVDRVFPVRPLRAHRPPA